MKMYAETGSRRTGQLLADLLIAAWVAAWVLIGLTVRRLVEELATPGQAVERAGDRVANGMSEVQGQVSRIPGIGGTLRAPFERLERLGRLWPAPAPPSSRSSTSWRCGSASWWC
ncbi:MAG TPA: hypothetical protein VFA46_19320 [Actinomycetes bacterium]|jgi:hypothetical protein|nr:hypothetical protein [Actinomycetes bacterium]